MKKPAPPQIVHPPSPLFGSDNILLNGLVDPVYFYGSPNFQALQVIHGQSASTPIDTSPTWNEGERCVSEANRQYAAVSRSMKGLSGHRLITSSRFSSKFPTIVHAASSSARRAGSGWLSPTRISAWAALGSAL